jgi:hypothetical protein
MAEGRGSVALQNQQHSRRVQPISPLQLLMPGHRTCGQRFAVVLTFGYFAHADTCVGRSRNPHWPGAGAPKMIKSKGRRLRPALPA